MKVQNIPEINDPKHKKLIYKKKKYCFNFEEIMQECLKNYENNENFKKKLNKI